MAGQECGLAHVAGLVEWHHTCVRIYLRSFAGKHELQITNYIQITNYELAPRRGARNGANLGSMGITHTHTLSLDYLQSPILPPMLMSENHNRRYIPQEVLDLPFYCKEAGSAKSNYTHTHKSGSPGPRMEPQSTTNVPLRAL